MLFDTSVLWEAFEAEGMLREATVGSETHSVGFVRPDQLRLDQRIQSTEYEMEYQAFDFPNLEEGDAVSIAEEGEFVVRTPPFVTDIAREGNDGTWMRALLTRTDVES